MAKAPEPGGVGRLIVVGSAVVFLLVLAGCGTSEPAFEIVQAELFSAPGAQPNAWADYDNEVQRLLHDQLLQHLDALEALVVGDLAELKALLQAKGLGRIVS